MNFQQLRMVREAIRHNLNLTEVAAVLYTAQSGVSKQIRDLEEELGVEIFVRKGKRLTAVTPAGQGVVQLIERILLETENLRRYSKHYTNVNDGRLVIAATHNQARYTLPRVVPQFTKMFPKVHLELRQGTPKYVAEMVVNGRADIGLATEALDEYPNIDTYPCFSWSHVVIVPRGHPLEAHEAVSLEDIAAYPIVTYNPEFTGRSRIDAAFKRAGVTPDIRLTAMDADVIKTYVHMGLGIGILAEISMDEDDLEEFTILKTRGELFAPSITKVALRRGALLRSYGYRLIELLAPHLKEADLSPGPTYATTARPTAPEPREPARLTASAAKPVQPQAKAPQLSIVRTRLTSSLPAAHGSAKLKRPSATI